MLSKSRENTANSGRNQRTDIRINHRTQIRVISASCSECVLEMRDFSEAGMYLFCNSNFAKIGDQLEVQTLEIDDAPIILTKVVRIEANIGFAVKFI